MTGTEIPAGWYPDPISADGRRWWDGTGWTAHARATDAAPTPPDPVAATASEPSTGPVLPSRRDVHARLSPDPVAASGVLEVAGPGTAAPNENVSAEPAAAMTTAPAVSSTLLSAALAVPAASAPRSGATTRSVAPAAARSATRIVAPPYQPLPVPPGENRAATRALVASILAVVTTVIMVLLHVGLQFRGISGVIGIILAIQAMVAAHRSGTGWARAVIALVISAIIAVIGVVSLVVSLLAAGLETGQAFSTRIADEIRLTDHAATVTCPATAAPVTGTSFACTETMPDGSAGQAVVTMTSPTSFSWRHQAGVSS